MIRDAHPVLQAFLGTLMTWGITALGASFVFVTKKRNRKLLDVCLGFAAGVMTAASFWSLLAPGIEMAEESGVYGAEGEYAFGPTAIGFIFGALFVAATDFGMKKLMQHHPTAAESGHGCYCYCCCCTHFFKGKLSGSETASEDMSIPPCEMEVVAMEPEKGGECCDNSDCIVNNNDDNNKLSSNAQLAIGQSDLW